MKFGIAFKLGVVLATVGVLASGLTGFYAYNISRDQMVQSAKQELLTAAQATVRRVISTRSDVSRNLTMLAEHPAALASVQKPSSTSEDQLATLFFLLMKANPSYFQIRLISAQDFGIERVRVDRDADRVVRVVGDDLQEKLHYPYVYDTLKVPVGATYLSPMVINHERGAHAGLEQPSVQLATPVMDSQGHAVGVIVINVDLNATFSLLKSILPPHYQMFLVNGQGDYLIHPDPTKAFGFDKGRRVLVQNDFPSTEGLLSGKIQQLLLEVNDGDYTAAPVVASFIASPVLVQSDESLIVLGLAQPLSNVLVRADQLGAAILKIVLAFCVGCILLATLVARAVTRPINTMGLAATRFAQGDSVLGLPIKRHDEIGVLARSFLQMQGQIEHQMSELKESRGELEHLALHDMLTGLPNRRLFQERLEQAVERARRSGERFALLFIDLDDFKDINDRLSHDAGDAALKGVANRLTVATRKVDTVARLGGDEFVVLLNSPIHREQVVAIAQKLLNGAQTPILFGEHALQVQFSIGISQYPEDGLTANEILSSADRAMYQAKAEGNHGLHFSSQITRPGPLFD